MVVTELLILYRHAVCVTLIHLLVMWRLLILPHAGSPVVGSVRLEFGDTQITTSTAITVDSTSIVYTGYTNNSGNFVGAVRI